MGTRVHDRDDDPSERRRDVNLAMEELCATAKALEMCLRRWGVPTLRLATDILCDAAETAQALQAASLALSRQLGPPSSARRTASVRQSRSRRMRSDARRGRPLLACRMGRRGPRRARYRRSR